MTNCKEIPAYGSPGHIKNITSEIDEKRLVNIEIIENDWLTYGGNYQEDRYSSLNQINKSTIDSLGLVWSINLGTTRGLESTPLVVDGIMYLTGTWSKVYAIDVRKGEIIWTFDPEVPKEYGEKGCCGVVNRGVALYNGKVYLGAFDGRLIAIDAVTGEKEWEVLTVNQNKGYTITGAPRIVKGKVIIGNGGAEYGVRGYVTAYDAISGKQEWRFYTVPGNPKDGFESDAMKEAAKTWTGDWWKYGAGGTAWDAMAYDPELNQLYIGTGNGSPWNRAIRSPEGGDNLYISSIVALNPDNGEYLWHYQTTPGDSWDYTSTQSIILADLLIDGREKKVLMQAPKNGFFYVIDRTNGEFISGKPYVYTNWAKSIDEGGRPIETPNSRYTNSNLTIAPSGAGGHNWHPMAFNPKNGIAYIPAREGSQWFGQNTNFTFKEDGKSWNLGTGWDNTKPAKSDSLANSHVGKLIAWDPITQKEKWHVEQEATWNGGLLATEDFIFQGTGEGDFKAYDSDSGKELWKFSLETGVVAAPISYMVDDVQYITIVAGWGGGMATWVKFVDQINPGGIYTFALGGKKAPPTFPDKESRELINLDFNATQEQIKNGQRLFVRYCGTCHGGGVIPNLSYSKPEIFESFTRIVGDGIFLGKGMPKFKDRLSDQNINDIKNYILSNAKQQIEKN